MVFFSDTEQLLQVKCSPRQTDSEKAENKRPHRPKVVRDFVKYQTKVDKRAAKGKLIEKQDDRKKQKAVCKLSFKNCSSFIIYFF